jgi:hypothetical protein
MSNVRYLLVENTTGYAGCIVYSIYLDRELQNAIGNVLVPYSENKYEVFFSDKQSAYTPKKVIKCKNWGRVIRCIDNAIVSMQEGGAP